MAPALSLSQIVKFHGSHCAVNHLACTIEQGEIVSILGPSGCGKTTLLRCVAGLEAIDDGEIAINNRVVSSKALFLPPERRNIGMVFQSYALWPHLTVFANVAMGLKVRRRPAKEVATRVAAVLETLELAGLADRLPSQLSGGQQQRVAVARAIVMEPEILLFDEPLSNLDARIRERVRSELHDLLRKLGITTLYVTHDKAEAMALSDRIIVMRGGVIDQVGTGREIYDTPATAFIADFIGRFNFLPASPLAGTDALHTVEVKGQRMALMPARSQAAGTVGFKPEDAVLCPNPAGRANVFELSVLKQTYFGSSVEVVAELLGTPVTLSLPETVAGNTLRIHLPPAKLTYFGADGQALGGEPPAPSLQIAGE
ncbi:MULTISPECIES: ABC transporter ATP-binding protein [unclassified Chelatococcus]|uniref:ABC transporter ATP-binding protein n=2 Tax=Chelatococcus TaxID=28209 RepID=UPI001BCAC8DF|nr:ABC transporter ATP-binding protein [Chelatococcus sp.]MBS7741789.1 ABC transporter ATP-binding protein [Chelatococcus sp. HY11]CAH1649257.1 sn-glycerol-3-phosphate import ATP-binding protein UgpC [Hyphomicrobiales bacterium]MBX3541413.1 ABC transporter ATP-binding protein [Chelatococcus sp.]MCO5074693.1 ABC transporter ATP-binding protein [Chelatococcus sp.]CAH1691818.1 sn-glycerol-3-phosphate import ATP-binding protein UgpC [Hyphomicrobiales bacterium]